MEWGDHLAPFTRVITKHPVLREQAHIAARSIRHFLTPRAGARSLVTSGLYTRIRHPIYLSAELLIGGLCIFLGYPALWLVSIAFLPWQLKRARRRDRVLEEAFADEYRTYRRGTWF
jgi:protein-S-isoprenylcysteine O-methyltransferase Ste14